ncbi:MAG TPA: hypothetical protein VG815_05535 [Chloroflexota bacterium]|jgi:hypothetical protein|nr:hypothetical protein [Chloroflexota bacterium]
MTTGSAGISFRKNELIRKGLSGGIFIAPVTSAAITKSNLFDPTTGALVNPLPAGYRDLGFLSTAGAVFARTAKTTDIDSWQSDSHTRTDIISDVTTITITPQETNQSTIGLFLGVDASTITPGVNGAYEVDRPAISIPRYYRVLALAVDTTTNGEIVYGRFLPRALVTAFASQTMANAATPLEFGVTITGYLDSVLGYPEAFLFGGEGLPALQVDMGFARAVTVTTNSTSLLVATTGNFYPNDVGAVVSGAGITVGTTIASYTDSTHVVMSAAATASAAGVAVSIAGEA